MSFLSFCPSRQWIDHSPKFEVLYLSDGNSELSYRLKTRVARNVGNTLEERKKIANLMGTFLRRPVKGHAYREGEASAQRDWTWADIYRWTQVRNHATMQALATRDRARRIARLADTGAWLTKERSGDTTSLHQLHQNWGTTSTKTGAIHSVESTLRGSKTS